MQTSGEVNVELSTPSDPKMVKPLRRFLMELVAAKGYPAARCREVGLALTEVFNNAIEHGSQGAFQNIRFQFTLSNSKLRVVVRDPGGKPGSAEELRQALAQAQTLPPLENDRGRGLYLIQRLVDILRIEPSPQGGTTVTFEKRL